LSIAISIYGIAVLPDCNGIAVSILSCKGHPVCIVFVFLYLQYAFFYITRSSVLGDFLFHQFFAIIFVPGPLAAVTILSATVVAVNYSPVVVPRALAAGAKVLAPLQGGQSTSNRCSKTTKDWQQDGRLCSLRWWHMVVIAA
jgi:hypothetical protein